MAMNDINSQGSQVVPQGQQTQADPLFEKRLIALQQRERELQKREASVKDMVSWESLKKMPRKDLFEKLAIDPKAPDEDPNDPMTALRREVQELKSQKEAEAKASEQKKFRDEVRSKLNENSDKYELINLLDTHDELFSYLESNKGEDGSPLDPLQIADVMESNLQKKIEPLKSAKKLADWFARQDGKSDPSQPPKTQHPLDNRQTLTSGDRSVTESSPAQPLDRMSSLMQAAAHLKFTTPQD